MISLTYNTTLVFFGLHTVDSAPNIKFIKKTISKSKSTGEKCVILAEVQFEARGLQCAEDKKFFRMCTMNNCESEEIVEAANIAISNLLPTKSSLYTI
ncbi:hypothetical protein NQ317_018309 [Molorchus minor]|uniref:Uncharacterized protein n=1 Tax=Molorchus minor TaxID=1323400 RepID=A0ABQ9J604_9CUCU|nr:hypothetical protein NQ317_018309 [Molorchus minor]